MTTGYYNPAEEPLGAASGWTQRFYTGDQTLNVVEYESQKVLAFAVTGIAARKGQRYNAITLEPDRQNIDLVVRFKSVSGIGFHLYGRGIGTTTDNVNCYRGGSSANAIIAKFTGAAATYAALSTVDPIATENTWFWQRFRINGSSISLKVWPDGSPEPEPWTTTVSDSSIDSNAEMSAGLWNQAAAGNTVYISWFGWATGGDVAPMSSGAAPSPPTGTVTIGTITPSTTSASVPYSYSAADQTGFEYRLNGGTAASIGASPATISGLTASTPYSIEVRAINASGAGAWSAAVNFTTGAPSGDTDPPTLTGSVTFSSITQTSYTAQWPAGSDNVAVTGYEYQIGSTAGAWTDAGNNLSAAITGRTAGTTETVYVRAYDAAGLRSTPAISGSVTLESLHAAGINVTEPLKNNTGTVLASQSGVRVAVLQAADLVSVYEVTGLTTNASGILSTISDAAIITGQQYHVAIKLADGSAGITGPITAS